MRSAAFFSVCLSFATLASCRSDNKVAGPYKPEFFVPCYSNCDPPPPPPPPPVPFSTVATAPGNPPGTLQVIALGMNDSLPYIIYQNSDGSWHWGGRLPDPNGVKFSAIATGLGNPHSDFIGHAYTLQVIATGANDSLPYVIYQNLDASWHWGGKLPDPGVRFTAVAAAINRQPYLQVVGIGATDKLPYLIWQDGGGNWTWAGKLLNPNGVQFASVVAGKSWDCSGYCPDLWVMGLGAQDHLPYLVWQDPYGNWTWWGLTNNAPFSTISGDSSFVPAYDCDVNGSGNPYDSPTWQVVGIGATDSLPYDNFLENPCNSNFFDLHHSLLPDPGVKFASTTIGWGNYGQVQVVGIGARDGLPYLIWQENGGTWHWGGALPDPGVPFKAPATGTGNGGNLQVILLGANDGLPYLIYQVNSSGTWHWAGKLPDP
jgi:hypothetical protein